uniref:EF-hand domain-containing protein n=1 Tax=Acrobeloides nanus TaxID=290746 RepID=A0A914ENP7_9BILA
MSIVKLEAGEPNTKPLLRKITHGKSVDVEDEYDLFKSIDPNNNGFVHSKDLIEAISISTNLFGLTREQAEELVRDIDANKDDKIDFPEFCTLMAKAKNMHMRRIVLYAAQSVLGRNQQAEVFRYITPYHNCSPPPVFIIVVSIIQIAIYAYFRTSIYDLDQSGYPGFYRSRFSPWDDDDSDSIKSTWSIRMYCDYVIDRDTIATNSYTKCQLYHKLTDNPKHPWEIWRAFTAVFLHANIMHLIGNLSIQILLGIPLELVHKAKRIAPIYFLGALLGHFMFLASKPDTTWAVGASGAVFALVGAHVANTAINWSEMRFQWLRMIFSILIVLRVLDEVAMNFVGFSTGVGHLCHLGGFIGGFLMGIALLRNVRIHRWERVAKIASVAIFILLNAVCICMMIYNSEPKLEDSKPVFEPAVTEAPEVAAK